MPHLHSSFEEEHWQTHPIKPLGTPLHFPVAKTSHTQCLTMPCPRYRPGLCKRWVFKRQLAGDSVFLSISANPEQGGGVSLASQHPVSKLTRLGLHNIECQRSRLTSTIICVDISAITPHQPQQWGTVSPPPDYWHRGLVHWGGICSASRFPLLSRTLLSFCISMACS